MPGQFVFTTMPLLRIVAVPSCFAKDKDGGDILSSFPNDDDKKLCAISAIYTAIVSLGDGENKCISCSMMHILLHDEPCTIDDATKKTAFDGSLLLLDKDNKLKQKTVRARARVVDILNNTRTWYYSVTRSLQFSGQSDEATAPKISFQSKS